jgi:hypothetical protein
MMRLLQIGGVLWLAAWSLAADQKGGAPKQAPRNAPEAKTVAPKNGAAPKGGGRVNPPIRMTNPGSMAAKLYRMTPEERERVVEKLPPARQEQLRKNLAYFDGLPKPEQERLIKGAERLANMTPEREREIRQSYQSFGQLPPPRKQAIQQALNTLKAMPDEQRKQVMESDQFKSRFSSDEQKIIRDISDIVMPPL